MHPGRHDRRSTTFRNDEVSSGTYLCEKSRSSRNQHVKKCTRIQAVGKCL